MPNSVILRWALSFILTFQFIFQPLAYASSLSNQNYARPSAGADTENSYRPLLEDPLLKVLRTNNNIPNELGILPGDPALDEDPFFLRNQEWVQGDEVVSDLMSSEDETSVQLMIPGTKLVLNINQSLTPLLATDEFIFLKGKENFQAFNRESSDLSSPGEGIFFISYREFLNGGAQKTHVPVYFFALPGNGWTKKVNAIHFPQDQIVAISNEQDVPLPLEMKDVRTVQKAERFNLFMSLVASYKQAHGAISEAIDLNRVLPAAGLTAGFGLLFTGINLQEPSQSLFNVKDENKVLSLLKSFFIADNSEASVKLDPEVVKRLKHVGLVVAFIMGASIVLKYTVLRNHFREKNAALPQVNTWRKFTRAIKDNGDVFAATMTTFNKVAPVWFANGIEFVGDRFFPTLAAGENTTVRKFLNKTVYFVRGTANRLPVTGKSWLNGLELTAVDTIFLYIQLEEVNGYVGRAISHQYPVLESRVDDAFDIGNTNTASFNQNVVEQNAQAGTMSAASSWSEGFVGQNLARIRAEVREEMYNEKLDPLDETTFNRRVAEKMAAEMQKMGVSMKDFLFDANSVYFKFISFLGYKLPIEALKSNADPSKFIGLSRPGLVISATKATIKKLEAEQIQNPKGKNKSVNDQALSYLKTLWNDLSLLSIFVKSPTDALLPVNEKSAFLGARFKNYIRRYSEAVGILTVLSYDGDLESIKGILPEACKQIDVRVLKAAAAEFQGTLGSFLPPEEKKSFNPEIKDRVALWQQRQALKKASEKYLAETGLDFNSAVATAPESEKFQNLYTEALVNDLGLYPDFKTEKAPEVMLSAFGASWEPRDNLGLESKVLQMARQDTQRKMSDPEVAAYFQTQDPMRKIEFEGTIQAYNYMVTYQRVMAGVKDLPGTSPSLPGRLQKFRQKNWVRQNMLITRVARGLESFAPSNRVGLGRTVWLDRNIPAWYYFKQANIRAMAGFITNATVNYAVNYYVFGLDPKAAVVVMFTLTAFAISAPIQTLNNFFDKQGWKTAGSFLGILGFSTLLSWSTFWGSIPEQVFYKDFEHLFNYIIFDHTLVSAVEAGAAVYAMHVRKKVVEGVSGKIDSFKSRLKAFRSCRSDLDSL